MGKGRGVTLAVVLEGEQSESGGLVADANGGI